MGASSAPPAPAAAVAAAEQPPAALPAADDDIVQDMFVEKPHRNPLVPLGAFVTTAVLCTGLYAFKTNNVKLSQKMMRMRVMAQGVTVAIMAGSAMYSGSFGPWKVPPMLQGFAAGGADSGSKPAER